MDRPIAQAFERRVVRCIEQHFSLVIAQGRGFAFVAFDPWPFYPVYRVATGHGIAFQQVVEQAGKRGELTADGGSGQATSFQVGPPGQYVRSGDLAV